MRISIVVPVLDESADCIRSLAALSNRADLFEVIVVDSSRDYNVCFDLPGDATGTNTSLCWVGSIHKGRARQMNLGASIATGDVLLFLHADTTLPSCDLSTLLKALPANGWGRFDVCFDYRAGWTRMIAAMMNLRSSVTGIATGDQALFVTRTLFSRLGGYSDLPIMEDIDLSRRLKRTARPLRVRQAVTTSARRWRDNGIIKTILLMWVLRFAYWLGANPNYLARIYSGKC
ncbi:MAG: glycosyl transferase [marine bacterium B5-7]|nr:MAG: glycosyl transferase [marine bacterium B5-7]